MNEPYDTLNQRWESTCKIIFNTQIGELDKYADYLQSLSLPTVKQKSHISGEEVSFVPIGIKEQGKFQSLAEADYNKLYTPININDLKDIDSILDAISECFIYTGNMVLGKSSNVKSSSDVVDSHYILESSQISFSKYIAYSYCLEYGDCIFGSQYHGNCSYSIGLASNDKNVRCLETSNSSFIRDSYYSHNLHECTDCMFCFGLRSSRNNIGNLQLSPDKYNVIKQSLVEQLAQELESKKSLPRLIDKLAQIPLDTKKAQTLLSLIPHQKSESYSPEPLEKAFTSTMKILFRFNPGKLDQYKDWLSKTSRQIYTRDSARPGKKMYLPDYINFKKYPDERILCESDAQAISKMVHMDELVQVSLENIFKLVSDVAFLCPDYKVGKNHNQFMAFIGIDSTNIKNSLANVLSKNCAYGHYPLESEYCFGYHAIRKSKYCINCYLSSALSRCVECHSCISCEDCYFSHNIENCKDCMFCFNVKSKRYAIGNVEYEKEEYLKIKKRLLEDMVLELEQTKSLKKNIFNLGSGK